MKHSPCTAKYFSQTHDDTEQLIDCLTLTDIKRNDGMTNMVFMSDFWIHSFCGRSEFTSTHADDRCFAVGSYAKYYVSSSVIYFKKTSLSEISTKF